VNARKNAAPCKKISSKQKHTFEIKLQSLK